MNEKTPNYIFMSGSANPLKSEAGDRRFFVIDEPDRTNEDAVDAALAAWFGVTKVMPERQILRERMEAAIAAFIAATPALTEPVARVPDGVWEALQRMIEDGLRRDAASQEDACTVSAYRDRARFLAGFTAPEQHPAPAEERLSDAARDVLAERRRQQTTEGYDPAHDDEHVNDEIAAMAAFYAMPPGAREWDASGTGYGKQLGDAMRPEDWDGKTGDRRRELVKAGALVLAELERIDRAAAMAPRTKQASQPPRKMMTNFASVAAMNTAFGNPKGDPAEINFDRVRKQCLNIADEFGELAVALGADPDLIKAAVNNLKWVASLSGHDVDFDKVRDALCDVHVFAYGAHHLMGVDADADMAAVVDGVMTRFIKDDADKAATIAKHAAAGVVDVYFEGEYPAMVMKSARDQPDAPQGKFLKSASYSDTVFPAVLR